MPGAEPVILQEAVAAFDAATAGHADLNPVRTNLLMRLVCLEASGVSRVTYNRLVMLSGYGTSFAYHPTDFWIMYNPPDHPEETEKRLVRGTGGGWEWLRKAETVEGAWQVTRESVDRGTPVQAVWIDDYVFAGYRDADEPVDRQVYALGGWREPGWMPWADLEQWVVGFGRLGRPTGPAERGSEHDTVIEIMERTVAWAQGDGRASTEWMNQGRFGLDGIEAYAADVADATKAPDYFYRGWLCCHAINRQTSGRRCAAAYFADAADLFPEPAASAMRAAAGQYEAASGAWADYRRALLGDGAPIGEEEVTQAWSDPAKRAEAAAAIRRAAEHEAAAVAEIEKALAALG
jgi:hypothetical protein